MKHESATTLPHINTIQRQPTLKPQDLLVVLKVFALGGSSWILTDIASPIHVSVSEVHGALRRLVRSQMFNLTTGNANAANLFEFIVHGVKYWLPPVVGPLGRGLATAGFGPPLKGLLAEVAPGSPSSFVWPLPDGREMGQQLQPFFPTVPMAAAADPRLHELLALVEVFRVGSARERKIGTQELARRLGVARASEP